MDSWLQSIWSFNGGNNVFFDGGVKMKLQTTKGHEVFALKHWFNPKTLTPTWTGKIRVIPGNPYYDEYFDWYREDWRNGVAIDHDMGDLTGETYG